ncbi:helix-turn-helix domain-containing protein [Streptomyces sp. NPDC090025]|uniref:helix-turn-helix domain-containing protein n=1 Tax=Streptomyces sp. NPDC090025 TaxID=3365922 RepID=UPI0038370354
MRLVASTYYSDAALAVYMKLKALGLRPEGCTASLATLARYLGLSVSTVQRGIAELRSKAPDGIVELPESRRRTLRGGTGTTARRRVREMRPSERFVWLPVVACERLRPRLLRAYAVISFAIVQNIPLTEGELAGHLLHRSGPNVGRPITTEAAGRLIDELAEYCWISVDRRAGVRGRHLFSVPVEEAVEETLATPDPDDRSGSDPDDRSLATEEDTKTYRHENEAPLFPSAVGELPVVEPANELDGQPAGTAGPDATSRDRALRAGGETPGSPTSDSTESTESTESTDKPAYRGPQLTFSPRLHAVLEPVRFLLSGLGAYVQRRIGQEISRQLDDGAEVPRLQSRLTHRLARTLVADIRDPGRWLLGVALPRWGCADPDCETGVLWSTGARCRACQEVIAERRAAEPPAQSPAEPPAEPPAEVRLHDVECCPECERPHLRGNTGLCADCRPRPGLTLIPAPAVPVGLGCRGLDGTCGRPAPRGLCWRCRAEERTRLPEHDGERVPVGAP